MGIPLQYIDEWDYNDFIGVINEFIELNTPKKNKQPTIRKPTEEELRFAQQIK